MLQLCDQRAGHEIKFSFEIQFVSVLPHIMLIGVAAGFVLQFFLAPPRAAYISTWGEFARSGWTDARAFGLANTLDSASTHLVIAPIVAVVFGGIASWSAVTIFKNRADSGLRQ